MNRSERLQPVAKLADKQERSAAQALGEARQAQVSEETRLQELIVYRQEYISDFQRRGRAGLNGIELQQFQQFLNQLDKAIEQQQQRIRSALTQVEQRVGQWQQRATKAKAINNVVGNLQQSENRQTDKREQAVQDDRSAQRAHLNRPKRQ
ncbi:flagellar export protein FliJ [Permianibacter sp. IMCC34836]|uniref:flagellar export protein FliJ n=1 Tax=Permianibacter fluminis TaxID=2738515 RepID=UPI0015573855|nr:flagellar export protein FliJ [Permianibacter fluminis]NQD38035.1 flagellar export protein FliJ [Permianibacter fluminis]